MATCTAVLWSCALRHHYSCRRLLTLPPPHPSFPVERISPFVGHGLQDLTNIFGKNITFIYAESGGGSFLKNAHYHIQDYTVSKPCRAVSEIFTAIKTYNITRSCNLFL